MLVPAGVTRIHTVAAMHWALTIVLGAGLLGDGPDLLAGPDAETSAAESAAADAPVRLPEVSATAQRLRRSANLPEAAYDTSYERADIGTATKAHTPILERPASVQVVPRAVLYDQQAIRLDQALRSVCGVRFLSVYLNAPSILGWSWGACRATIIGCKAKPFSPWSAIHSARSHAPFERSQN